MKSLDKNKTGEIKHFCNWCDITVQDDIIVYLNNKIIISKKLRKTILTLLHETHLSAQKKNS